MSIFELKKVEKITLLVKILIVCLVEYLVTNKRDKHFVERYSSNIIQQGFPNPAFKFLPPPPPSLSWPLLPLLSLVYQSPNICLKKLVGPLNHVGFLKVYTQKSTNVYVWACLSSRNLWRCSYYICLKRAIKCRPPKFLNYLRENPWDLP